MDLASAVEALYDGVELTNGIVDVIDNIGDGGQVTLDRRSVLDGCISNCASRESEKRDSCKELHSG